MKIENDLSDRLIGVKSRNECLLRKNESLKNVEERKMSEMSVIQQFRRLYIYI